MCVNSEIRIIIFVFSVYLTVTISKVSANENTPHNVPCKQGWYFFGEKCYKILPVGQKNWTKSVLSCTLEGGELVSIHSSELQEFLTVFLLPNSKSNAWIGLNDLVEESKFVWVDGSTLDYVNWENNWPSRSTKEDCVEMRYKSFKDGIGKWNVESCSSLRPHICQADKNNYTKSPDPRFCSIEDGGGWKYLNSCYHIVKKVESWEKAERYCEEKYKGYLVSILDDNTELFLDYIMRKSKEKSKNVWIGIKMGNNSSQKWTSGWHVTNKKFTQDQWHFVNGTCAVKTNFNSWGIAPCHNKYPFICEKMKYNIPVLQRPPSDDWECPHSGKDWLDLGGDSCYYIENKKRNWLDANYECGKKGGTLTSFHSENETNLLHPHVLETQERLLIGLKRNFENKNIFEWADGTKVIYQNWHEGEPNSKDETCGELWTESMKWNDIPCNIAKAYICKTQKKFSRTKFKDFADQVTCKSALSKNQTYSSGIPMVTVVGAVFCALLVGLLVGVIVYHYRDYSMRCFTKKEKNGYTSVEPGSDGPVSEKVLWKPQGDELQY